MGHYRGTTITLAATIISIVWPSERAWRACARRLESNPKKECRGIAAGGIVALGLSGLHRKVHAKRPKGPGSYRASSSAVSAMYRGGRSWYPQVTDRQIWLGRYQHAPDPSWRYLGIVPALQTHHRYGLLQKGRRPRSMLECYPFRLNRLQISLPPPLSSTVYTVSSSAACCVTLAAGSSQVHGLTCCRNGTDLGHRGGQDKVLAIAIDSG
jgi:hypothetical protein